jgi:hypothetical protein
MLESTVTVIVSESPSDVPLILRIFPQICPEKVPVDSVTELPFCVNVVKIVVTTAVPYPHVLLPIISVTLQLPVTLTVGAAQEVPPPPPPPPHPPATIAAAPKKITVNNQFRFFIAVSSFYGICVGRNGFTAFMHCVHFVV